MNRLIAEYRCHASLESVAELRQLLGQVLISKVESLSSQNKNREPSRACMW